MTIRIATSDDAPFLEQMLAIAANWRPGARPRPVSEIMRENALAHYVAGWPQDGDFGLIAEGRRPLGAVWWRFFTAEDPGYGFVDAATPEFSIGVIEEARGRGLGERLIRRLVGEGRERGLHALCLSVEPDNPAVRLYERLGFQTIAHVGGALTMVRNVAAES